MGSIPITRSNSLSSDFQPRLLSRSLEALWISSAHVAQLAEHVLGKDEVSGSIPLVGSSKSRQSS